MMKKIACLRTVFSKENLLFSNAILCFSYAVCYVVLIVLPFSQEATKSSFSSGGVVSLNIIFLLALTLNLNTITIAYRQIAKPRKGLKLVYLVTFYIWLLYVVTAYCLSFFLPGFITHFHHYIWHAFRRLEWPMALIALVFAAGLCILFTEYYRQAKMQHVLLFIIPAILQFSFKVSLPFLFFITGWCVFGGCQLLLYFSIVDSRRLSARQDRDCIGAGNISFY
jgi:hypothetical protein